MIILKDRTALPNERVVAEIACRDHRCAQPPGQPCIARSGQTRQVHLVRKKDWVAANGHLVRALVPNKRSPRVDRAIDYVLAQDDDWDVLFPATTVSNTGAAPIRPEDKADPGAAYADLLSMTTTPGGSE